MNKKELAKEKSMQNTEASLTPLFSSDSASNIAQTTPTTTVTIVTPTKTPNNSSMNSKFIRHLIGEKLTKSDTVRKSSELKIDKTVTDEQRLPDQEKQVLILFCFFKKQKNTLTIYKIFSIHKKRLKNYTPAKSEGANVNL